MSVTTFTDGVADEVDRPVRVGSALPSTCKRGETFFLVGTANKVYCSFATDVWTEVFSVTGPTLPSTTKILQGLVNGQKIASGTFLPAAASTTIVTGLATVVDVVVSMKGDPSANHLWVSASVGNQIGTPAAGSIIVKTWKGAIAYGVLSQAAVTTGWVAVDWIAIGT